MIQGSLLAEPLEAVPHHAVAERDPAGAERDHAGAERDPAVAERDPAGAERAAARSPSLLTVAAPAPAPAARPVTPAAPAEPRLDLAPYSPALAHRLESELGIGHVLAQVLVRRGLADPEAARAFLAAGDTHPASELPGIAAAVDLVRQHIGSGGRIVVHGDYDVDGVCATAIAVRALRSLGADVGWFLPSRTEDGYGLSGATVQRLAERGVKLILAVDCGITAVEEVAAARAAGLDVVVCDHHAPRADGRVPDCPVVHPALGDYGCPDLCGAAVALKLAEALGAPTAPEDLELAALATVADLVPLQGENRRIVRDGLTALAATIKPGLRALMAVSRVDPGALDAGALGFRLAPRINAAGRLQRADAGLELLLCDDPDRARAIALELDAVNAERRAVEQRIVWEAEAQVRQLAADGPRPAYVLAGEDWHPGVIGIVASRIVERHHRPTILIALDGAGAGTGSGRSIPGFDLLGALHAGAQHLGRYGGHRMAAGLTIAEDEVEAFRAAVETHAASVLTPDLLTPSERVDAVVSGTELGLELVEELEALEPCGMGNPAPRLLVPGARIEDVRGMGEGRHARFSVRHGGVRARAVQFGCDGVVAGGEAGPLDAIFRLERNSFNGAVEARLLLRHARPCTPGEIRRLGDEDAFLAAALRVAVDDLEPAAGPVPAAGESTRRIVDRRGHSPLSALADAVSTGESVLAVCADPRRRLAGLASRIGGFTLAGYSELEADPAAAGSFALLVALDPPLHPQADALLRRGEGVTVLTWGEAELRFSEQMHELEYGLRTSLVSLYRDLRARGRVAGEELERLLRGDGPHGRSAQLAGRLVRVLTELELVSLDRDLPALAIAGQAPTSLDRSPSFRVYRQRYEDGKRYLSSARAPIAG